MQASPFDEMAADYDASFTHTACAAVLRGFVAQRLAAAFTGRERLLELGCGTGEDAIRLARAGHHVVATDASAEMIRIARLKALGAGVGERIEFHVMPMEAIHALARGRRFDGVFSNFGALNCVADLPALAHRLSTRLDARAPLLFVAMGRYVPWEWVWFLARGDHSRAFRRLRREGVEWRGLRIHYPSPGKLARALAPWFEVARRRAVGIALPPSYAAAWLDSSPRALAVLSAFERVLRPFTASLGDHFLIEAARR